MNTRAKVLMFFACDIIFFMAANFVHPVTPTLFRSLGLGQYMFGIALAAMLLVNFLVSPFWGKLNDFVSSKVILLICCIGYAFGQWFFGQATTEWGFVVVRAFTGIFTAGSFVAILTYIVNTSADDKLRASYLTIHATIQAVASAFGYLAGGLLGEISVHTAINAQVITLFITGIAFFAICERDNKITLSEVPIRQLVTESNPFSAFIAVKDFFKGALASIFILSILQSLGSISFEQSFNYYLKDVFNLTSGYNGLIKGVTGLLSLIVNSTLILWLMRKDCLDKSVAVLCSACSIIMTVSLIIVDPVIFIIGNTIVHVLIMGVSPLIQNTVAELSLAENRNLIMGFYNSMKSLGSVLGALLSGMLYMLNPKLPFIFGIGACVTSVIMTIKLSHIAEIKKLFSSFVYGVK